MSNILIHNLILAVYLPLGVYSFFRPIYLLYLFVGLIIFPCIPTVLYNDNTLLEIIRFGSIKIYVHDYLLSITFLILIYNSLKYPEQSRHIIKNPVGLAVVMLVIWDIIIGIVSYAKGFGLQNILRYLSTDSLMFIAFLIPQIKINHAKEKFYDFTIVAGVLLALFALIRYYITKEVIYTSSGTARTLQANSIVLLTLPLCYLLFYKNHISSKRIISSVIVLSLLAGISMAGYRSGWLVLFFTMSVFLMYKVYSNIKLLWMPMSAAALITLLLFIGVIHPYNKYDAGKSIFSDVLIRVGDIFDLENKTTQGRLSTWEFALDVAQNSPLLGLGRLPVYMKHRDESNVNLNKFNELERGAHNIFFNKLIHEGIAGVSIIALFFYIILKEARKLARNDMNYSRFLSVYLMGFIIFSMLNTSFSSMNGKMLFFIMVGFLNNEVFRINLHEKHEITLS
jgi:O-antigen ligase